MLGSSWPAWLPAARRLGAGVRDLFLPVACVACDRLLDAGERGIVCGRCWSRMRALPHPQCTRCGHPLPGAVHGCRWCELLPPFVRAVRSWCWIGEPAAAGTVHALKYDGWTAVAEAMASRMARLDWPADVIAERRAVVPVPLARARERERGFNQSALLARALAARWAIPAWESVLERGRPTATQTRLTPDDRRRNVAGAFRAPSPATARLRGAHVVLVDDVVTTAATLNACATALFESGARILSYVTFGRARTPGDRS